MQSKKSSSLKQKNVQLDADPNRRADLENVLKQLATNEKRPKLINGAYAPCYGVTCVMPLRKDIIDNWGVPFAKKLSADPIVTAAMAVLPASSYHVTLRGLEKALPAFGPEHTLLLYDNYRVAQQDLLQMFAGQQVTLSFCDSSRTGTLDLKATSETTEHLLRAAEEMVLATLLLPNTPPSIHKDLQRKQRWHLTLGYSVTRDKDVEAAALTRIIQIAKASGGFPEFVLEPPQICSYRSMERFEPLFAVA